MFKRVALFLVLSLAAAAVGIEFGLVVTGPVGGGTRVEYGATGRAPRA